MLPTPRLFRVMLFSLPLLAACATTPRGFRNKTVAVTGASSGIGRGVGLRFAADGANVVVAARRTDQLEQVAREAGPDRVLVVTTDVTRPARWDGILVIGGGSAVLNEDLKRLLSPWAYEDGEDRRVDPMRGPGEPWWRPKPQFLAVGTAPAILSRVPRPAYR